MKDKDKKKPRAVKDKKSGQTVAAPGYKMATTPKKGESATKNITPVKGGPSVASKNGPYIPQPKAQAKAAPVAKKPSYKGGSKKAAFGTMKKNNKRQKRGGLKKC